MNQLFRQEVIENRKNRLAGVISLVQPPLYRWFTFIILLMVALALIFLSLTNFNRKESVTGILQPDQGLLRLHANQSGIVTELLVAEGEKVKKNQPLVRIRMEKFGEKGIEINQVLIAQAQFQLNSTEQQKNTMQIKHQLEIQALKAQRSSLKQQLKQQQQQQNLFTQRNEINQGIVEQMKVLAGTGYLSDLELKKQKDKKLILAQQESMLYNESLLLNNQLVQVNNQLSLLPVIQKNSKDLLQKQIMEIRTQLAMLKQQHLAELRAPASGIVTGLLTKQGKSVNINQNLLGILPENSVMQAVLYVPPSAFGFIQKGQSVKIRYDAFPYQKFGTFLGNISEISANLILPNETVIPGLIEKPCYRVIISLSSQNIDAYGRPIPLSSGMKLSAEIILDQRSLLQWIFDPVFSNKG